MSEGEQTNTETPAGDSTQGDDNSSVDNSAGTASPDNQGGATDQSNSSDQGGDTGDGTGEGQAAGDNQDTDGGEGGEGTGGDNDQIEGAPENYEAFNLPEGYSLEGERLDSFTEYAKANNLTQESAQKAVDLYLSMQKQDAEAQDKAYVDLQTEWQNTLKESPYMKAGEGFEANVARVNKGVNIVQDLLNGDMKDDAPALAEMLKETGMGNHPAVNFMFMTLEKHLGEDGFVGSKNPANQRGSVEDRFYGKSKEE
ncbi:MAG: hypothetical protein N0C84_16960 [Candidatus Thiodiazotropha taylori]|uniref:Peptidase n=1 Tax=Candidatus Thiodiazotropha taylori TaxID=2792791 RepID=A0A9E4T368_9GAMM|nr:hypothetical protein [Candidatus Thiodiazotropha taylori]MCW4258157.1 hypothetical protein [Candidatus Thiodiazotropha taylori]